MKNFWSTYKRWARLAWLVFVVIVFLGCGVAVIQATAQQDWAKAAVFLLFMLLMQGPKK